MWRVSVKCTLRDKFEFWIFRCDTRCGEDHESMIALKSDNDNVNGVVFFGNVESFV